MANPENNAEFVNGLNTLQAFVHYHDDYYERRKQAQECGGVVARTLRGTLSVRKFAASLGVSPAFLSKVERGKEPITPELARKLVDLWENLPEPATTTARTPTGTSSDSAGLRTPGEGGEKET